MGAVEGLTGLAAARFPCAAARTSRAVAGAPRGAKEAS